MHIGFISIIARTVGEICYGTAPWICLLVRLEKVQFVLGTESERFMFSWVCNLNRVSSRLRGERCFLHFQPSFSRITIGVGSHEASPNLMQKQQSKWH
jgi:hypothetical protein